MSTDVDPNSVTAAILAWDPKARQWQSSCTSCISSNNGVVAGKGKVEAYIDTIQNPLQLALFFKYDKQYGSPSVTPPSICVLSSKATTQNVVLNRNSGAYGKVSINLRSIARIGFGKMGELQQKTVKMAHGHWRVQAAINIPALASTYGRIDVYANTLRHGAHTTDLSYDVKKSATMIVLPKPVIGGILEFTRSNVMVNESLHSLTISVIRHCGVGEVHAKFSVHFKSGEQGSVWKETGMSTDDYNISSGTLLIADGQAIGKISIGIADDNISELNETIRLQLTSADTGVIGYSRSLDVTILENDDVHGAFELVQPTVTVREGERRFAELVIVRKHGSSGSSTVKWTIVDGTANAHDYHTNLQPIVFAHGQLSSRIRIEIIEDDVDELPEAFSVQLLAVSSGRIGSINTSVVTILPKNNHEPVFIDRNKTAYVGEETVLEAKNMIYRAKVRDDDLGENGHVSFIITSRSCNWVDIDENTGVISNRLPLMPWNTTGGSCLITIKAGDHGKPMKSNSLTVEVFVRFTQRCVPGTYSKKGILPCEPCPLNSYQPLYKQTVCLRCPEGTSTAHTGSRRLKQCRGKNMFFSLFICG